MPPPLVQQVPILPLANDNWHVDNKYNSMPAILNYLAVNLKSKPDRYTIWEIHTGIDEVWLGLVLLVQVCPAYAVQGQIHREG